MMDTPTRVVFLFDIDGTILLAGPLAEESYRDAFFAVLGKPYSIRTVDCAGRTDPWIVREVLLRHGHVREADTAEIREAIFAHFLAGMRKRLQQGMRARLIDGVAESLGWLERQPMVSLGLLTGNLESGARIKLEAARVYTDFLAGAYGSDHHDRNMLGPLALARFEQFHACQIHPRQFWIVGDSVHDILCARAAGFRVLAVASGNTPRDVLAQEAPDILEDGLSISVFERILAHCSVAGTSIAGGWE